MRGHHQLVVLDTVGRYLVHGAGAAEPRNPDEDFEQVVETGGREVLDVRGAHHELVVGLELQQTEMSVVLDPSEVEVGGVTAVVDDALRVRVREADRVKAEYLKGGRRPVAWPQFTPGSQPAPRRACAP